MEWTTSRLLAWLSVIASVMTPLAQAQVVCPWEDPDLQKWSEASTWDSGAVPVENDTVVIPAGQKVLLDTPIPRLLTLQIDGVLVWGDVPDIRLETSWVLVNGELHIGSEDCKFEEFADIFLYGMSDSAEEDVTFGRKFIGVNDGAILEIHGQPKKSWTKLTETVGPSEESCGNFYDSWNEKFNDETQEGPHVVVWNPDGTIYDQHVSATESGRLEEVEFFASRIGNLTAKGKIVAIAIREDIGTPTADWEPLYKAIEALGGTDIRNIQPFEPYAFIAVTGHPLTAQEQRITRGANYTGVLTASATYTLESRNLIFSAESATTPSSGDYYVRFRVTAKRLAAPIVTVLDDVSSWFPGDQVVIASTDYDWEQAEVKTIVECMECSQYQFRVEGPFQHTHFGEITYGVDERAEVGLLSRNIRIVGEAQDACYSTNEHEAFLCERFGRDTFGGHMKVVRGGFARVEGAELYHMGQLNAKGFYPFHWHMCDEVPGQYFNENSVWDAFSRCVTIHGTDNSTVSDNVCYLHFGHGMMLEDSAERWNVIHRNLMIGTKHGIIIPSDKIEADCNGEDFCNLLSSFWITRPENYITDNVAAGSDGNGIVLSFADVPLGLSYDRQNERGLFSNMSAQNTKVELFTGNVMHSNLDSGLWFDSRISAGQYHNGKWIDEDGIIFTNGFYAPIDANGNYVDTILSGLTFYRNDDFDAWVRCGNIVIEYSSFADTTNSLITTHSTGETSCDVRFTRFIGQTDNKGKGFTYYASFAPWDDLPKEDRPRHEFDRSYSDNRPEAMQHAIIMYQGPVFVDSCYFDRYYNLYFNDSFIDEWGYRPVHPSSAFGFRDDNDYPIVPTSGVSDLKWGYCDGENDSWKLMSGNESTVHWGLGDNTFTVNFHDYDGSLTGVADSQVVRNRPFMTGPECLFKAEWDMSICPYHYTWIQINGDGGVLDGPKDEEWPVHVTRDDAPEDELTIQGKVRLAYPLRVNRSYTIRFNTTLGDAPREVKVKVKHGLQAGESIRLALCLPKTTTEFRIKSTVPKINSDSTFALWTNSLEALDADTTMMAYYWNPVTGFLYFKMASNETFSDKDQEYPGDAPREITIERLDGDDLPATCDTTNPSYEPAETVEAIVQPLCSGPDSGKGIGAPVVHSVFRFLQPEESCATCPVPDPIYEARPSEPRGCFQQDSLLVDFATDMVDLKAMMTPQFCISRCRQKGFPFAGLNDASVCECAESIGRNGEYEESVCNEPCTGDSSQTCGGDRFQETYFYTSGAALTPAPDRCGLQNRGEVFQDHCIYLNNVNESFWSALTRCESMGGTLSKIDSQEKMDFVARYLMDVDIDVWFGVYGEVDNWRFMDGSLLTFGNWRTGYITPEENRFLYLQEYRRWKWNMSPSYRYKYSVCDLTLDALPEPTGDCGYKHKGTLYGNSERCFYRVENALTYHDAELHCKRMFGRLATVLDAAEKIDVEAFLNSEDDDKRYWVEGEPSQASYQKAYDEVVERTLIELPEEDDYYGLCVLDNEDINGCASGWTKGGDSCYWDTGLTAQSYSRAAGVCDSERTSVIAVDSQDESDFLQVLTTGTLWTDLRYDGLRDAMVLSNGEEPEFSQWSVGEPLQALSNGLCVVADVGAASWLQTPCRYTPEYKVVCEAPLSFFNKTSGC